MKKNSLRENQEIQKTIRFIFKVAMIGFISIELLQHADLVFNTIRDLCLPPIYINFNMSRKKSPAVKKKVKAARIHQSE